MSENSYTADSIQLLTCIEAVRKRPGMYIGGTGPDGMHHLLWEVLGNAIDEHLAGSATRIRIQIDGPQISVEDDGEGFPLERIPNEPALTALEVMLTRMHASGAWRRHVHIAPALHGIGLAPVNALSERLTVEVWRERKAYSVRYAKGEPLGPLQELGQTRRTGTRVTFEPDYSIFERSAWDRTLIVARARELAALNPGLTVIVDDEIFRCPDGLSDLVRHLAGDPCCEPIRLTEDHADEIEVDVAMHWTERTGATLLGFVGQSKARGVHVQAFSWAVASAVRSLDDRLIRVNAPALFEVAASGLVAVLAVNLESPRFGLPTRDWLENFEVGAAVLDTVTAGLSDALARDHALRDRLLARIPR